MHQPSYGSQRSNSLVIDQQRYSQVLATTEGHPEEPQAGRLQGDHVNQQDPGLPFCSGT